MTERRTVTDESSHSNGRIWFECHDRIATITLAEPDRLNVLNAQAVDGMLDAIATAVAGGASILLLRAEGRAFSAGADLREREWLSLSQDGLTQRFLTLLNLLANGPLVSIALIDGLTLGGGVGLVAACDFALATKAAKFALPEVKRGLMPAVLSPFVLAALGRRQALRMMLTAEELSAEQAGEIGLVTAVYQDSAALAEAGNALVQRVKLAAPGAIAEMKALTAAQIPILTGEKRELVMNAIGKRRASDEFREGVQAFRERRKPDWTL